MNGSLKLGIIIILVVLVGGLVLSIAKGILALIGPLAIVAGVGLIIYGYISRKALGGGGRRYLP